VENNQDRKEVNWWKELPPDLAFGAWVREQRKARGMTRKKLARVTNTNKSFVRLIEDGTWGCSHEEYLRFCRYFLKDVDPDDCVFWDVRQAHMERILISKIEEETRTVCAPSRVRVLQHALERAKKEIR